MDNEEEQGENPGPGVTEEESMKFLGVLADKIGKSTEEAMRLRVLLLKNQVAFLGDNPTESGDNQEFVKRLVKYSLAQSAVIEAQNGILTALGIL